MLRGSAWNGSWPQTQIHPSPHLQLNRSHGFDLYQGAVMGLVTSASPLSTL
jgi:hypothetical protein